MTQDHLRSTVQELMDSAWREPGFCVPNANTYPFQWLWDSCFHALVWNELGSQRALIELTSVLAHQHASGFVPHMTYWAAPDAGASFWGRPKTSSITQPPMYGHVIAELERAGTSVSDELYEQAVRGLQHLFIDRTRTSGGLIPVFHPWETGCDDSARWDSWRDDVTTSGIEQWRNRKGTFVDSLAYDSDGAPVSNEQFTVGSIGFNALAIWNGRELLSAAEARNNPAALGSLADLRASIDELTELFHQRWDSSQLTWVDDGPPSGTARTADALLGLLVDPRPEGFDQLIDNDAFGAAFGVRGTHRDEPTYDPATYWRGSTWPQLTYLLAVAARSHSPELSAEVSRRFVSGATTSGLAEYWHPESGQGLGAIPQSWTGLALLCSGQR